MYVDPFGVQDESGAKTAASAVEECWWEAELQRDVDEYLLQGLAYSEAHKVAHSWGLPLSKQPNSDVHALQPIATLLNTLRKRLFKARMCPDRTRVLDEACSKGSSHHRDLPANGEWVDSSDSFYFSLPCSGRKLVVLLGVAGLGAIPPPSDIVQVLASHNAHTQRRDVESHLSHGGSAVAACAMGPLLLFLEGITSIVANVMTSASQIKLLEETSLREQNISTKIEVLTNCLNSMHAVDMVKAPAMLQVVEGLLTAYPNVLKIHIMCKDISENRVIYGAYDSESGGDEKGLENSGRNSATGAERWDRSKDSSAWGGRSTSLHVDGLHDVRDASQGHSANPSSADASREIVVEFQEYEIRGRVSFTMASQWPHSSSQSWVCERRVLGALVKAVGRRAYELYRGSRNKRSYVETKMALEQCRYAKPSWLIS